MRLIVKNNPHVVQEGMHTLQAYTERNTTFVTQKAISLQMFGACTSSGMGILESCKVAGIATGFNYRGVRKWAMEIYVVFGILLTSLENVTDDGLDKELEGIIPSVLNL